MKRPSADAPKESGKGRGSPKTVQCSWSISSCKLKVLFSDCVRCEKHRCVTCAVDDDGDEPDLADEALSPASPAATRLSTGSNNAACFVDLAPP